MNDNKIDRNAVYDLVERKFKELGKTLELSDEWIDAKAAMAKLSIKSEYTLDALVLAGKIEQSHSDCKYTLYSAASIEKYIKSISH